MFETIRLRGATASLVWGYHTAAAMQGWTIRKRDGKGWTLTATVVSANAVYVRSAVRLKELLFTAPRDKGRWCWQVIDVDVGTRELRATLGKPFQ